MRLKALCDALALPYDGKDIEITGINTLKDARSEEISFFENPKYLKDLATTRAAAVLLKSAFKDALPPGVIPLVSENPYLSMARASALFQKPLLKETKPPQIEKGVTIAEHVHIGNGSVIEEGVTLLSGVVVGENVHIGRGSIIHPNVTLYNDTIVGKACILHAGCVIGSDGFGYAHTAEGEHVKIYHNGRVVLEDRVEIGANTTIDRAVFGETRIKEGSKIDNLVQIGHNSLIGEHTLIAAQTGISGSTVLGRNIVMGGQSATVGHLKIGDFATIAARGGVTKSIEGGKTYSGFPLMEHRLWLKLQARIQQLIK